MADDDGDGDARISVPVHLNMWAQEVVCPSTLNGWLWYCDEHDAHGVADSEAEAEMQADAHVAFYELGNEDEDFEPCEMLVWQRTEHERVSD